MLLKETLFVRLYTFLKIPLLAWARPIVVENSDNTTRLLFKLNRRTKNHLGTMYFGALAMGAEAAVAFKAIQTIQKTKKNVSFVFKDFNAEFLKRAEGNVEFVCNQGPAVQALVEKCITSGERETETFESFAFVPSVSTSEPVARFKVTLSVKLKK